MGKIHDGQRVRSALLESGMTQKELSSKLGVARSTLGRMLNQPSWTTDYLMMAGGFLEKDFFREYTSPTRQDVCVFQKFLTEWKP